MCSSHGPARPISEDAANIIGEVQRRKRGPIDKLGEVKRLDHRYFYKGSESRTYPIILQGFRPDGEDGRSRDARI
jgi:hypothetical protein